MSTPRHLRHPPATLSPAPYHPRPLSPPPQHTLSARHALPARHTRPLHTHLTTPYLRPFILYLYICTSPRPPTAHCDPILNSPPPPFRTAPPPSSARAHPHPQHLTAILLHSFPLLLYAPSAPSSAEKLALPRLKQAVTHLWKSFVPKEEEDLSSTSYPDDIMWITL